MGKAAGSPRNIHRDRIGAVDRHGGSHTADRGCTGDGVKCTTAGCRYRAVVSAGQSDIDPGSTGKRTGLCSIGSVGDRDRLGINGFSLVAGQRCRKGETVLRAVDGKRPGL